MAEAKPVPPRDGGKITMSGGRLVVPDRPIIPFIEGDGIGRDIWRVAARVIDAAVEKAYGGRRAIAWTEVFAGEKAYTKFSSWLPEETTEAFREYVIGIKGPLATPVGGGIRSLNVALRQNLDLYVCLRPIRWFRGVPSPVRHPERVEMVIFRENTEDIYAGIEWEAGSEQVKKMLAFMEREFPREYRKIRFPGSAGIGLKPVSKEGTERLIRAAIEFALRNKRRSVTVIHKGNIMKFTEGAFRRWAYDLAEKEFGDRCWTSAQWERIRSARGEEAANAEQAAALGKGRLLVKDVVADLAMQQVLTQPEEFDVIATLNLNGDYLSEALAAQVGGIAIVPSGNANFTTGHAIFEATHGTAPQYADLDKVNPGSMILSGEMMLRHLGWTEAADRILRGMEGAIGSRRVTYDFARMMRADGAADVTEVKCSEFGDGIIGHM